MVFKPSANGVVELGSTEPIFQSSDLTQKVRVLFNFDSLEMGGSWGITDQGENDPSSLWLNDPTPTPPAAIEIKDSLNNTTVPSVPGTTANNGLQISKPIQLEIPSSSSLTENPSVIHAQSSHQTRHQSQTQSFFTRELNFSDYGFEGSSVVKNGNSHLLKPKSGEILNFGENKRSSYISGQSQFPAEETNQKKRLPASRGSHEEGS
jgi:transcription factor MYC2